MINFENHPLGWRFHTDEGLCEFTDLQLQNMSELTPTEVAECRTHFLGSNCHLMQQPLRISKVKVKHFTNGASFESTRLFLLEVLGASGTEMIFVTWSGCLGVKVPAATFVDHWNDFCLDDDNIVLGVPNGGSFVTYAEDLFLAEELLSQVPKNHPSQ